MDSSVQGTGQLVLARANAASRQLSVQPPLPPGCATGGCIPPVGGSCVVQGATVDPRSLFLILNWAPPSGSPADVPLVFTYKSDVSNATEFGSNWSAPHQRFADVVVTVNPSPVNVNTPSFFYSYTNSGTSYSVVGPSQNSLVGNTTTGWTETQPDGTSFKYLNTGVLSAIANRANVRWTMIWDAGFNHVQAIQGPLGRRTTFIYNASNFVKRIVDPGGRITTLTVNANSDLSRIISPELCTTTFVYDGSHHLVAWINPLGDRTTFVYKSGTANVSAVQQPLGQRTTFASVTTFFPSTTSTVITSPRNARTTLQFGLLTAPTIVITDPFGNQALSFPDRSGQTGQTQAIADARGVRTSFTFQLLNNGVYTVSGIQKTGFNSGTGLGQYAFFYNSNSQVKAVVDEIGNRSTFVWNSQGNRAAVIDPFGKRTSYIYDSLGRLSAVQNALGQRATQTYDTQGRPLADINPLGQRFTYAYDINSQLLRTTDPLGHITTTVHDHMNRLTVQIDPVGNRTSFTYDANGRMTRVTAPLGRITTWLYDNNSRVVATIDPLASRTSYAYDAASNQIRSTNPLNSLARSWDD